MTAGPPEIDRGGLAARVGELELGPLLEAAGPVRLFLVGGAVRDLLLGRERADLDVAVEGDAAFLARRLGGEVREHERFRTAVAQLGERRVDLATTRAETYARPGALPEVAPAGLADDLARRDFTVNAMAVPLRGEPELIDPHGGAGDLEAGTLRVLHPGSFVDDPTRALRAARYGARFSFELEPETEALIRSVDLGTVSVDRIEAETLKLAAEPEALRGFELLQEWGTVTLAPGSDELIEGAMRLVQGPPWSELADRATALHAAALGHLPGEAGRRDDVRERARDLARQPAPARPSEAVALASGRSAVELVLARAMGASWLEDYVVRYAAVGLEISGDDLLAAGVPEGPAIGRGLEEALRAKLDGELSGRDAELSRALEVAEEG